LSVDARFCDACGQSVKVFSRPWLEIVREVVEETLDLDGRMFRSLVLLMRRPGFLSAEYIRGRRVAYTPPVRMYLVISLLFFLVLPLILPAPRNVSPDHQFSVDLYSKGMFIMLPVFALLLKGFYRRFFYWDHLVFSIYLFSASYVVFAFLLSLETLADEYLLVAQLAENGVQVSWFAGAVPAGAGHTDRDGQPYQRGGLSCLRVRIFPRFRSASPTSYDRLMEVTHQSERFQ
jgi:hypothetical protein